MSMYSVEEQVGDGAETLLGVSLHDALFCTIVPKSEVPDPSFSGSLRSVLTSLG